MSISPKLVKGVLAAIVLVTYSYLTIFGLLSIHHHHTSMANCPYMIGQHSICQMDAMAHLQAWEDASTGILPIFKILLPTVVVLTFIYLWSLSPPLFSLSRWRLKSTFSPLYRYLFSQGILHPKAP